MLDGKEITGLPLRLLKKNQLDSTKTTILPHKTRKKIKRLIEQI